MLSRILVAIERARNISRSALLTGIQLAYGEPPNAYISAGRVEIRRAKLMLASRDPLARSR